MSDTEDPKSPPQLRLVDPLGEIFKQSVSMARLPDAALQHDAQQDRAATQQEVLVEAPTEASEEPEEPKEKRYKCRAKGCGYSAEAKWRGRCPGCKRYYDIVTKKSDSGDTAKKSFASLAKITVVRESTGIVELDKVLGGPASPGQVRGQIVMVVGGPGLGKSTLLVQLANAYAQPKRRVLYASGEQTAEDVGVIAQRIGAVNENIEVMGNADDLSEIISRALEYKPAVLIVDSAQMVALPNVEADYGTARQVEAVANYLASFGKKEKVTVYLVSHVNKDGEIKGTKSFEHIVDTVMFFDAFSSGDEPRPDETNLRRLSSGKNRYGPSGVEEIMEMTDEGLVSVSWKRKRRMIEMPEDDD